MRGIVRKFNLFVRDKVRAVVNAFKPSDNPKRKYKNVDLEKLGLFERVEAKALRIAEGIQRISPKQAERNRRFKNELDTIGDFMRLRSQLNALEKRLDNHHEELKSFIDYNDNIQPKEGEKNE